MHKGIVTEEDFRLPEFRGARPEDYEFRADGMVVRKDRWERAVREMCSAVGLDVGDFEICDVVARVEALAQNDEGWLAYDNGEEDVPEPIDVQLADGSILVHLWFEAGVLLWNPNARIPIPREEVRAWREHQAIQAKV